MKGKYRKGVFLWVRFDLTADRELGEAYNFFHGGSQSLKPYANDKLKEELQSILSALHRDAICHNERIVACQRYNICVRCGGEIDLLKNAHEVDPAYPEMGLFKHKVCPPRRDVYRFDL